MGKYFFRLFFLLCISINGYAATNKSNQLINSIQVNDLPQLANYLEAGINPDLRGDYGITPLMYAVSNKNTDAIKVLIKFNADVNATDIAGVSPLHIAARNGDNEIVRLLIQSGANVNAKDSYGMTPVMKASAANKNSTVALLVDNKADEFAQDKFGYSANKMVKKQPSKQLPVVKRDIALDDNKVQARVASAIPRVAKREIKPVELIEGTPDDVQNNTPQLDSVGMPWLEEKGIYANNVKSSGKKLISIKSHGRSTPNLEMAKQEKATNVPDFIESESRASLSKKLEQQSGTTVVKTKTRKIAVGKAKMLNDPIRKWQVTQMDVPDSKLGGGKVALHVYFNDENQEFGDLLMKVLRQTQYYKVKYQLVQNVKNNTRYIKVSYFNNPSFAKVFCHRILENKLFHTCKIVKVNNSRGY